jgi:hypothetical protein
MNIYQKISATVLTLLVLLITGCVNVREPIREHRAISQPENQKVTVSVGSSLFRLTKRSDLPNVYGGRDIYGGKVDRGFAEVKLVGIRAVGLVDLLAFDVNRESSETTMDRYVTRPAVELNQTLNIGASPSSEGIPVTIDTKADKEYVLAGVKITFVEVRKSAVVFTVQDQQPKK